MVIAPSDEVVIRPARARPRRRQQHTCREVALSRRYAIIITLQTKRRPETEAPRRNPICTFRASTSPLVLSRIAAAQGRAMGPSGNPRTGGATAYRAPSNFRCCAGFWMPVNTMAATRSIGRRPKSERHEIAIGRAPEVRCTLWGFERGVTREWLGSGRLRRSH